MSPKKTDPLLPIQEAAERLGTTKGTLYQWRHKKRGPRSFKVGTRVVYRESAIEAYLAAQERRTGRGDAA